MCRSTSVYVRKSAQIQGSSEVILFYTYASIHPAAAAAAATAAEGASISIVLTTTVLTTTALPSTEAPQPKLEW